MSEYQAAFFIVPARILNLPNITISFLRIYETIFQFWNHNKDCFLTNEIIHQRTGVQSHSTLMAAFAYFEKHGELKRITKDGKRYLVQPIRSTGDPLPVDKGVGESTPPQSENRPRGVAKSTHNTKNINTKNINNNIVDFKDQKRNSEPRQAAKFWEPGNPDYDRVNNP